MERLDELCTCQAFAGRWLGSMDLDQEQLPNCVEVTLGRTDCGWASSLAPRNWYDAKANETSHAARH